jgi:hypothetical protein
VLQRQRTLHNDSPAESARRHRPSNELTGLSAHIKDTRLVSSVSLG